MAGSFSGFKQWFIEQVNVEVVGIEFTPDRTTKRRVRYASSQAAL